MLPEEKINALTKRHKKVEELMNQNQDPESYVKLASEFAELDPVIAKIKKLQNAQDEIVSLEEMIKDKDPDIREEAKNEIVGTKKLVEELTDELRILLLPKDEADTKNAIIEIRAGTGGSEAALFAGNMFRMYQKYAENKKWKVEVIAESQGDVGGYKEIIASITGKNAFAKLKFESGVHRVQRVPETESSGRIHTSAATVAVLPEAEDVDIQIKNEDVRIDTMRASGAGGQHVNKTDSAVRITHLPTGIVVTSAEKSQHQNRALAMKELRARLYDQERQKAHEERADSRKGQVGSGDRSERIRTYNFPQGRITDHRIGLTLYKLEKIIEGEGLDELIDALVADYQASQLAAMDDGE